MPPVKEWQELGHKCCCKCLRRSIEVEGATFCSSCSLYLTEEEEEWDYSACVDVKLDVSHHSLTQKASSGNGRRSEGEVASASEMVLRVHLATGFLLEFQRQLDQAEGLAQGTSAYEAVRESLLGKQVEFVCHLLPSIKQPEDFAPPVPLESGTSDVARPPLGSRIVAVALFASCVAQRPKFMFKA